MKANNLGSIMDAGDHFKNGARLEIHLSREHLKIMHLFFKLSKIVTIAFISLFFVGIAKAQTRQDTLQSQQNVPVHVDKKPIGAFLGLGGFGWMLSPVPATSPPYYMDEYPPFKKAGSQATFCAVIGIYFNNKHYVSFEGGFRLYDEAKVGTFTYNVYGESGDFIGRIYRRYDFFYMLLPYHYLLTPSRFFQMRLGVTWGAFMMSGWDRYEAAKSNHKLEKRDSDQRNKVDSDMLIYGPSIGFQIRLTQHFYIDIGYRYLLNTGMELDNIQYSKSDPIHLFNFCLGTRF